MGKKKRICVCYVRNTECVCVCLRVFFALLCFPCLFSYIFYSIFIISILFGVISLTSSTGIFKRRTCVHTHTHTSHNTIIISTAFRIIQQMPVLSFPLFLSVCFFLSLFPYTPITMGKNGQQQQQQRKKKKNENKTKTEHEIRINNKESRKETKKKRSVWDNLRV